MLKTENYNRDTVVVKETYTDAATISRVLKLLKYREPVATHFNKETLCVAAKYNLNGSLYTLYNNFGHVERVTIENV